MRRQTSALAATIVTVLVLTCACARRSATAPPTGSAIGVPPIAFEKYQLPNGLEVILHEDHRLPLVGVDLWYHVGPMKERAGRTGFAHLFEHMMFEGSKHVGEKAHFKNLEAAGASDINGTTDFDRTNYFETMPSNQVELALWLESDRMGFLLDTLDAAKLTNQRDVVRNERRQSVENQPYGLVEEAVYHQLFPRTHPYYADVIGSHADVESARLTDVRDFFKQYYAPNNATLAVAGDFDPARLKESIAKYFGPIPTGPPVTKTDVPTPTITSERRQIVSDAVQLPRVYLAWLAPKAFAPGDAELDLGSRILGGGKSSRLYRKLVYEQQIAQDARCEHQSLALGSPFVCSVTAKPGVKPEQIEQAAAQEVSALASSGPTAAEVERARNAIETRAIQQLQQLGGFGGVADTLNYYNQYTGDPGYLPKDMARYDQATAASIQQYVASTLGAGQRVVVYAVPGQKSVEDVPRSPAGTDKDVKILPEHTTEFERQEAWREHPPQPGPTPTPNLPIATEFALASGLKVLLAEDHHLPLFSVEFVTRAGLDGDDPRKPGVAGFMAAMLTEGTSRRSAPKIADDTDQIGATLRAAVSADNASVGLGALSRNADSGLDLLSDLIQHPAFDTKEIERVRKERQTALLQLQDQPTRLALAAGQRALYGADNPYGYDRLGTKASLAVIARDDLTGFWSAHAGPGDSALLFAGDLTPQQARSLAEKWFGEWRAQGQPPAVPAAPSPPRRRIVFLDHKGAPQSTIFAVGVGLPRSTPDYPTVTVLNDMLGGLFSSRINMNLREQHGYTYGAFSFYSWRRGVGPFVAGAEVRTDITPQAVKELFSELDRVRTSPLSADEVKMGKDAEMRSLPANFETDERTVGQLAEIWTYDLPRDYFQKLPAQIEAVNVDLTADAVRRFVHPENMLLIVVGDRSKVEPGLKALKLGPLEVWSADGEPPAGATGAGAGR
jgi:zinc protease